MNNFVKSFVFPFIISLLIFSTIAFAMVGPTVDLIFAEDNAEENGDGLDNNIDGENNASALKAPGKGNLTLVLIGTDEIVYPEKGDSRNDITDNNTVLPAEDPDKMLRDEFDSLAEKFEIKPTRTVDFITVVSIDSASGKTFISSVPTEARVSINNEITSLHHAYYFIENSMYGLDYSYFASYVNAITGCNVDYYAYIDTDDYVKVADKLSKIPVKLDEGARKTDVNGNIEYMIPEGEIKISSKDLKNIIKHESFTSVTTKTSVLSQVSQYVLEKSTTTGYYINFENKFREITSYYYNTNIDFETFEKDIPLYFSYSFFTPVQVLPIGNLTTSGNKSVFTINTESTIKLFK